MTIILIAGAILLLAFWGFTILRAGLSSGDWVELGAIKKFPLPQNPPSVSILVPARNEEEVIGDCIRSLLEQDYSQFEIIAIDDDSTDRTGEILDELAKQNPNRLRVLHLKGDLPPNWVGKNYALTMAAAQSRSEWLLCSDADILHEKETLSRAMGYALKNHLDLLSLLPRVICVSFWEKLMMPLFGVLLSIAFPLEAVNDPRRRNAVAAGGFILVSRTAFDAVKGYEPTADHLVDDVLLAKRIKEKGFRIFVAFGEKLIRTRMYSDFKDLWEGIEKGAAVALDFRFWMLGSSLLFLFATTWSLIAWIPAIAIWARSSLPFDWSLFLILTAVTGALLFCFHFATNIRVGVPRFLFALLSPLAYLLYAAILISSFSKGRYGVGVAWKGRRYYGAAQSAPKAKLGI